MQFLDGCGLWPILNCLYLPLVHVDATLFDGITKEVNSVMVELSLLEFEIQMAFTKFLEDLRRVLAMFDLVPVIDEDVIIIDNDKMMEEFLEHLVHETLVDGG